MKIDKEKIDLIFDLHKKGIGYRKIAKILGIHKNTVLRYLNKNTRFKHNQHSREDYYNHKERRLLQQKQYSKKHEKEKRFYYKHYYQTWLGFSKMAYGTLKKEHKILPYTLADFRKWLDIQPKICYLCGEKLLPELQNINIDHIIPIRENGKPELTNLSLACKKCNQIKGGYNIKEVIITVEKWRNKIA